MIALPQQSPAERSKKAVSFVEACIANERRASNGSPAHKDPVHVGRSSAMQRSMDSDCKRTVTARVARLAEVPENRRLARRHRLPDTATLREPRKQCNDAASDSVSGRQAMARHSSAFGLSSRITGRRRLASFASSSLGIGACDTNEETFPKHPSSEECPPCWCAGTPRRGQVYAMGNDCCANASEFDNTENTPHT